MSSIFYADPELVIALGKRVLFLNPNDLQIFKEIILPDDLSECGLKITHNSNNEEKLEQNLSKDPITIQNVRISPDKLLLALTTSGQKALLFYKLRLEHAKLVSIRPLSRTSSALAFSGDSTRLLVTDKTGDCYEYDCEHHETLPKLLFGHLGVVYDILWSNDKKFIITCDRDDKIRVTNYPETYDVHSYCLGHKEFVAGLELLNDEVLMSISGDKTIKLWEFKEGKQLLSIELPAPGVKFVLKRLPNEEYEIAVLLHQPSESVVTYVLTHTKNEQWRFAFMQTHIFDDMICNNLCYAQDILYVTGVENKHFVIKLSSTTPEPPLSWINMVEDQFKTYSWTPEDRSAWFKKKYDNVSEYLERKKRRIEEKQK